MKPPFFIHCSPFDQGWMLTFQDFDLCPNDYSGWILPLTKADFILDVVKTVVSRNDSTTSIDEYVQKLINRGIERIIKQWQRKKPLPEIAKYFGVRREWVHIIINCYTQSGMIPVPCMI